MKLEQVLLDLDGRCRQRCGSLDGLRAQFALVFGARAALERESVFQVVRELHPGARLLVASTAGNIFGTTVGDDAVVITAVALEKSRIACAATSVRTQFDSGEAGRTLGRRLRSVGLVHVLVLSDGQRVNGTELAAGLNEALPAGVILTGGLAGDGLGFEQTVVGLDEPPSPGRIVAIGFYGQALRTGFGSSGGWAPLGAEHTVTVAQGNILLQLDGEPALEIYKRQIGEEQAAALPASGLRFPLCVAPPDWSPPVVRSVLAVDESTHAMIFAGDVPSGSRVRFMQATQADLVEGAALAARQAAFPGVELAVCVSCVGRRVVLGAETARELERVQQLLGASARLAGFYSYGELAPAGADVGCQLHNQTMTITTLREEL